MLILPSAPRPPEGPEAADQESTSADSSGHCSGPQLTLMPERPDATASTRRPGAYGAVVRAALGLLLVRNARTQRLPGRPLFPDLWGEGRRGGRAPKLPHSTPPAMTSTAKLADQRQQSQGGWQGLVLPPRRADDPLAQCRLQTAGPGGQRLELRDGTHLGPGCHRLEVSLPRGVGTRGDPLSPRQASDCLPPALQPPAPSGAQMLSSPSLPPDSCRGHGDIEDMGLEAAAGPCPQIYTGTVHSPGPTPTGKEPLPRGSAGDRTAWAATAGEPTVQTLGVWAWTHGTFWRRRLSSVGAALGLLLGLS